MRPPSGQWQSGIHGPSHHTAPCLQSCTRWARPRDGPATKLTGRGRPAGDSVLCVLSGDSRPCLSLPSLSDPVSQPHSPSLCVSPRTPVPELDTHPRPNTHARLVPAPSPAPWPGSPRLLSPCPALCWRHARRGGGGGRPSVSPLAVSRRLFSASWAPCCVLVGKLLFLE